MIDGRIAPNPFPLTGEGVSHIIEGEVMDMKDALRGRDCIPDYVDTLDGFRALGVLLVMIFHFWQQSWFTFSFTVFGYRVDFTNIVVNGSFGVDILFILSGFCLYYPLAMHPERRLHVGSSRAFCSVRMISKVALRPPKGPK